MCRFGRIKNHITQDVWHSNYCAVAYVWSLPKSLKSLGQYQGCQTYSPRAKTGPLQG